MSESTVDPRARGVLVALCVTVTVAYGVLYYSFTVLAPGISADTGWSRAAVTSVFSAGSLTGAFAGVLVGRVIQRRGPRVVMTAGSLLGALGAVLIAAAPNLAVFTLGWLVAGAAGAGTFYPPAFAALTQWYGDQRVRAITTLTLAAALSSTIFAPLVAFLDAEWGWRATYVVLGAIMLVVTAPAHALVLRLPWHPATVEHGTHERSRTDREVLTSRTFVLVAASGALTTLVMFASLVHLVPLLLDRGMSVQLAAWALGLSGAGQVVGRLLYAALARRLPTNPRAALVMVLLAAMVLALALVPGPVPLLVVIAVLAGAARGLFTLVGATVVSDHWGPERYAALNGVYNAPVGVAAALSPAFGAAVVTLTGSVAGLFVVLAGLGVVGAVLAAVAGNTPELR
ncbi:MFS transporter [Nocardioides kongjuensis]|uniref:MFS family permease n=1 Tax=Nocardioides kongjuensis TaxID=349522 RepID=A0A852RBA2_9ACTN|nr:MFS transporter [Nocardioides kongjuensis]NYD32213.1 MFS family permease [Nocardioides kongjuensis]